MRSYKCLAKRWHIVGCSVSELSMADFDCRVRDGLVHILSTRAQGTTDKCVSINQPTATSAQFTTQYTVAIKHEPTNTPNVLWHRNRDTWQASESDVVATWVVDGDGGLAAVLNVCNAARAQRRPTGKIRRGTPRIRSQSRASASGLMVFFLFLYV